MAGGTAAPWRLFGLTAGDELAAGNCAAIPEALLESELFGYLPGTWTGGASKGREGLIAAAHEGTLFLDEIGDMPLALQAKLLRVLSESEITPLGARAPRAAAVRFISASHQPLAELVRRGSFREDLLYRLNAAELRLPALRQRSDLQTIADQMLATLGSHLHLGDAARAVLAAHAWPGNLRELHNALRYAAALCGHDGDGTIEPDHLPDHLHDALHRAPPWLAMPASPPHRRWNSCLRNARAMSPRRRASSASAAPPSTGASSSCSWACGMPNGAGPRAERQPAIPKHR